MSIGGRIEAASVWNTPEAWTGPSVFQSVRTSSGENVTQETAMTVSTYHACVTGIAEDFASLDGSVYEFVASKMLADSASVRLEDHALSRLLWDMANPEMDAFTFKQTMQAWRDGWGNGRAEIERDGRGRPIALWPIHPSRIYFKRTESGDPMLWVKADDRSSRWLPLPPADCFEVRGHGDGDEGASVLKWRAPSIGLALATQTFAESLFKNDLGVNAVLTISPPMQDAPLAKFREGLREAYGGSAKKANRVYIANGATDLKRMTINPDEAQALESRQFSVPDICRWFRRDPSKVGFQGQAKGWDNVEGREIADRNDCIKPRAMGWIAEANRKILRAEPRNSLRFIFGGTDVVDSATQAESLQKQIGAGVLTPNEARHAVGKNPLPPETGADDLWLQGAMRPMRSLLSAPATSGSAPAAAASAPVEPAVEAPAEDAPEAVGVDAEALAPVFLDCAARIVGVEFATVSRGKADAAFYAKQRARLVDAFTPVVSVLARSATGPAHDALRVFASTAWSDPVARAGEAFKSKEPDLAAALAAAVVAAVTEAL